MNAIRERWHRSVRAELLDQTLVWNLDHLRRVLAEYEILPQRTPTPPGPRSRRRSCARSLTTWSTSTPSEYELASESRDLGCLEMSQLNPSGPTIGVAQAPECAVPCTGEPTARSSHDHAVGVEPSARQASTNARPPRTIRRSCESFVIFERVSHRVRPAPRRPLNSEDAPPKRRSRTGSSRCALELPPWAWQLHPTERYPTHPTTDAVDTGAS